MIYLLLAGMLLTPPSLAELGIKKERLPDARVKYVLPNGFGIDNITVISDEGDMDAAEEARALLEMLHKKSMYFFEIGGIEASVKAHSKAEAMAEIKRWIKVIGGSL